MRISDRTCILILLVLILGLSYTSYGNFKKFSQSLSEVKLPKIEMPEMKLEEFFSPEKEGEREWTSPDGRLKLTYSASWTEANEAFLGYLGKTGVVLKGIELLFFAQRLDPQGQSPAFLMAYKTTEQKNLEEILEEIEESVEEQNGKIRIEALEQSDEVAWLEMFSEYTGQPNSYSKGKVIFDENATYLVIFSVYQTDWPKFEQEAQQILESAQLVSVSE